jgi:hypothetical protein
LRWVSAEKITLKNCPDLKWSKLSDHSKVEKILKGSLNAITSPSPSVKIQILGGKVCLSRKSKTLLGVVNKFSKTKSLLTSSSNVLSHYLKYSYHQ